MDTVPSTAGTDASPPSDTAQISATTAHAGMASPVLVVFLEIAVLNFTSVEVALISVGLGVDRSLESAELLLSVRLPRIRLTTKLERCCISTGSLLR